MAVIRNQEYIHLQCVGGAHHISWLFKRIPIKQPINREAGGRLKMWGGVGGAGAAPRNSGGLGGRGCAPPDWKSHLRIAVGGCLCPTDIYICLFYLIICFCQGPYVS